MKLLSVKLWLWIVVGCFVALKVIDANSRALHDEVIAKTVDGPERVELILQVEENMISTAMPFMILMGIGVIIFILAIIANFAAKRAQKRNAK